MIFKSTLTNLNGHVLYLIFSVRDKQLTYITDIAEYSTVHCAFQQMAERMAKTENAPLLLLN